VAIVAAPDAMSAPEMNANADESSVTSSEQTGCACRQGGATLHGSSGAMGMALFAGAEMARRSRRKRDSRKSIR
jgi:hypothetical protein